MIKDKNFFIQIQIADIQKLRASLANKSVNALLNQICSMSSVVLLLNFNRIK